METLRRAVISNIVSVATIHSATGWSNAIQNRKTAGLSFCLTGKSLYTQNGETTVSDRSHAVLLPQGGTYDISCVRTGDFALINFRAATPLYDTPRAIPMGDPEGCWKLFEQMKRLSVLDGSRMRQLALFYELLDDLLTGQPEGGPLAPALRLVRTNLADPALSNEALARECGISEVYLRRLFARQLGTTPKQYVLHLRMNLARQLLSEGVLKVSAVAEQCGFSSAYHFCRAFRQANGLSPTEYAARNRFRSI